MMGGKGSGKRSSHGPPKVRGELGIPDKPGWFKPEHDQYWNEVIAVMQSQIPPTLSLCDGPAIASLATNMALMDELRPYLDVTDKNAMIRYTALDNQIHRWCSSLLLTPKARVATAQKPKASGNSIQALRIANGLTA